MDESTQFLTEREPHPVTTAGVPAAGSVLVRAMAWTPSLPMGKGSLTRTRA